MWLYLNINILFFLLLAILSSAYATVSTSYQPDIRAILFDCDGVLVDTEYLKFLSWKHALESKNLHFTIEEYMPLVGHSSKNILYGLEKAKQIDIPEEVIALKNEQYRVLQAQGVKPIEAMVAFAKRLEHSKQQLGIKIGLASSAPRKEIIQNLEQIGLEKAFDLILSGSDDLHHYEDKEGKNKPKPYIYIEAAKRLGILPVHCLVFEDTAAGVEAAAGAGMTVIAVPNCFTIDQDFSKAKKVVYSHAELLMDEFFQN